eukprot:13393978-Alexandrium_andersonii.AAC.1
MSASLVGSEMCIRDSLETHRRKEGGYRPGSRPRGANRRRGRAAMAALWRAWPLPKPAWAKPRGWR